jgi:hypothetical protein
MYRASKYKKGVRSKFMYRVLTSKFEEIAVCNAKFRYFDHAVMYLERQHYAWDGCVRDEGGRIVYESNPEDEMSPYVAIADYHKFNYVAVNSERWVVASMDQPVRASDGNFRFHNWMRIGEFEWPWPEEDLDELTRSV